MTSEPVRLSLVERTLSGAKRTLGMFLYLWALLALFALHESIVLAKHQIDYGGYGRALVTAWVLAKVMLVVEDFNLGGNWFEGRPLIYRVVSRAALLAVMFLIVHTGEGILIGLWKGQTLSSSTPQIGSGSLADILSVAVILSVALIPFFAFRAIERALGPGTLRSLLLAPRRAEGSRTGTSPPDK